MSAQMQTFVHLPVLDDGFRFTDWMAEAQLTTVQTVDSNLTGTKPLVAPDRPRRTGLSAEVDRRLRRMISNRESARRSRVRKQRHIEDLHSECRRLRSTNRDIAVRLGAVRHYSILLRRENELLWSEFTVLRQRLEEISRAFLLRSLLLQRPAAGSWRGIM